MLLSICTPCMNRTYDLKKCLPSRIAAAAKSPPVEISIVNYNSIDDLDEYMKTVQVPDGVTLTYNKYTGRRRTWHMAHGFNLAILASQGEYFWLMGTDVYLKENAVQTVRGMIESEGFVWMHPSRYKGIIVCQREEFIAAGGYDERFEFYGPEDREIDLRLTRRGGKLGIYPWQILEIIETPNIEKSRYYRKDGNKTTFSRLMRGYYYENDANNVLVANQGREWGQWI